MILPFFQCKLINWVYLFNETVVVGGSSGWVKGWGQETWNLCGHIWRQLFCDLFLRGRGYDLLAPLDTLLSIHDFCYIWKQWDIQIGGAAHLLHAVLINCTCSYKNCLCCLWLNLIWTVLQRLQLLPFLISEMRIASVSHLQKFRRDRGNFGGS